MSNVSAGDLKPRSAVIPEGLKSIGKTHFKNAFLIKASFIRTIPKRPAIGILLWMSGFHGINRKNLSPAYAGLKYCIKKLTGIKPHLPAFRMFSLQQTSAD